MFDNDFKLLHDLSMIPVKEISSQIEKVRGNFIFDLDNYCFLLLIKGFDTWFSAVQSYNFRMLHDFGILPLKKFLIHHEKVRPIFVFESRQLNLNVCHYIVDMVICPSLINVDSFVFNEGKESFFNENCCIDQCVDEVRLNHHKHISSLYDKRFTC